jgi:protein-tyrosine-phosphatase
MSQTLTIVFVCEHGAAKSIIAAAYFNKLAGEANSNFRALARATNPDSELSPKTIAGLHEDDLTPTESTPQKLSPADVESAQQIISFCELPEEYQNKVKIEKWDAVPPVSESYEKARDAILEKLNQLLK